MMVDGNGILHPKGFGMACHLGVLMDLPCVGIAKNLFCMPGIMNDDEHKKKVVHFVTNKLFVKSNRAIFNIIQLKIFNIIFNKYQPQNGYNTVSYILSL